MDGWMDGREWSEGNGPKATGWIRREEEEEEQEQEASKDVLFKQTRTREVEESSPANIQTHHPREKKPLCAKPSIPYIIHTYTHNSQRALPSIRFVKISPHDRLRIP